MNGLPDIAFGEEAKKILFEIEELLEQCKKSRANSLKKSLESIRDRVCRIEMKRILRDKEAVGDIEKLKDAYKKKFDELSAVIRKLENIIQMLKEPPYSFAYFVRFVEVKQIMPEVSFPVVDVVVNGQAMRVFVINERIDCANLKYGQKVLVTNSGHVAEALPEFQSTGVEARVVNILEDDHEGKRVLVEEGEIGQKIVVHLASSVLDKKIDADTHVLVDKVTNLVVEVLPTTEEKRFLVAEVPDVTFDDIGGHEEIVEQIKDKLIMPIVHADLHKKMYPGKKKKVTKGFLLEGPPGTGKTSIAKASINLLAEYLKKENQEVKGHFFYIGGPELLNKFVGETERAMRKIFEEAKKIASPTTPVIIFFDDAEALFKTRGSGISSDVEKTNVTQITTLLDGLEERGFVIVIMATNRYELIDKAVIRPGRLDRIFKVNRPDREGAAEIFSKYLEASWDVLNEKYNTDVYVPKDRHGRPRRENGRNVELKFNRNPQAVKDYLIEKAVNRIFLFDPKDKRNHFIQILYESEQKYRTLTYGEFISGGLIENIVDRAKEKAIKDYIENKKEWGIELRHLYSAIEDAFSEIRIPTALSDVNNWMAVEGKAEKTIVGIKRISHDSEEVLDEHDRAEIS